MAIAALDLPIDRSPLPRPDGAGGTARSDWVAAAPFRAHVRHLADSAGISWRVVAWLAGVSPLAVQRLVEGRNGRLVARIDPGLARQLFMVTVATIDGLRQTTVPALSVIRQLRRLERLGWDRSALARRLQVPPAVIGELLDGAQQDAVCSRLVEARVLAGAEVLGPPAAWAA